MCPNHCNKFLLPKKIRRCSEDLGANNEFCYYGIRLNGLPHGKYHTTRPYTTDQTGCKAILTANYHIYKLQYHSLYWLIADFTKTFFYVTDSTNIVEGRPKVDLKPSFRTQYETQTGISYNTNNLNNQYRYNPRTLYDVYKCYNRAKLDLNDINVCDAISRMRVQDRITDRTVLSDTYGTNPFNYRRSDYSYRDYEEYNEPNDRIQSLKYKSKYSKQINIRSQLLYNKHARYGMCCVCSLLKHFLCTMK